MATFAPELIAEVRDRIRLEDWVGRSVALAKKGRRWVGLCPFHSEKTPSFGVSAERQLFHCFGCGAGGDLFEFTMRLEGLDFPAAVRLLAGAAGVELPETQSDPSAKTRAERTSLLYEVNERAQAAFREALLRDRDALAYVEEERGLDRQTLERFEVGYAPANWTFLCSALARAKLPAEAAVELGLLGRRSRDGQPYDRLRGRIVFPIRVPGGRIAGFGARRADWVDPDGPKYLNSPESAIYDKSAVLYGLPLARDEIRRRRQALLVEGYVDVLRVAQAGFPHVVAGCGTALTDAHARALARLAPEVITLYDGDAAGRKATERAATLLLAAGAEVRVVPMPEGLDPDQLIAAEGPAGLAARIEAAPSAVDHAIGVARRAAHGAGVAGVTKAVEAVKPLLMAIADPLVRDVAIDACARALGLGKPTLTRHLSGRVPKSRDLSHSAPAETPLREPPLHVVEVQLLKMVIEEPMRVVPVLESRGALEAFSTERARLLVRAAREASRAERTLDGPEALEVLQGEGPAETTALTQLRRALLAEEPESHPVEDLVERLLDLDRRRRTRELTERLDRCADPEEQTRILEAIRLVQAGPRSAGP